jgi:hypothetical protein
MMNQSSELKVFISTRESICGECGENLGSKAWITLTENKGALCLACADLEHLVFLPTGDAALTRRSRKHSTLNAVVLKWSNARKRYERQGILVEAQALAKAEKECLSDHEFRERQRKREALRREELDSQYMQRFAERIRELFPGCPQKREQEIAEHACLKYSSRIGRTVTAKNLDEEAIRLAVIAHIRHKQTNYDELLSRGYDRYEARDLIAEAVESILKKWESQKR